MANKLWLCLLVSLMFLVSAQDHALAESGITRPPAPDGVPKVINKKIEVNRKTKWLYAWQRRGKSWHKIYSFRVSIGAWDTPTPEESSTFFGAKSSR